MLSAAVIDGGGSELSAALDGTLMMELAFIAIFPSIKLTEFLSNGMPKSAASRSYTIRTYKWRRKGLRFGGSKVKKSKGFILSLIND